MSLQVADCENFTRINPVGKGWFFTLPLRGVEALYFHHKG